FSTSRLPDPVTRYDRRQQQNSCAGYATFYVAPPLDRAAAQEREESMRAADVGDKVRIHFIGKLGDGTIVERSDSDHPPEFTLGRREVMSGLEELVKGMRSGEKRQARIPPDRAHGKHRNDLLLAVERERFPSHVDPYTGQQLWMRRENRDAEIVRVVAT